MIYVFDTNSISQLFRSYYPDVFVSMWEEFENLVGSEVVTSTREVRREIEDRLPETFEEWVRSNSAIFTTPSTAEAQNVAKIYAVPHFQHNIEKSKFYKGGKNADPFVVARAMQLGGTVVTEEALKPNAAKVPNICQHFSVPCTNLNGFMNDHGWKF
ncbi:MAG: PIN domain-containing protein [Pseudomonadales bacterium]